MKYTTFSAYIFYRAKAKYTINSREVSTPQYKKYYVNLGHLKHASRVTVYLILKRMPKAPNLSFHAGFAEKRLVGPYFTPSLLTGLFTTISYGTSFQSC